MPEKIFPAEEAAKLCMDELLTVIHTYARSKNVEIIEERLMDIRLRLAYQTGNYDFWGV